MTVKKNESTEQDREKTTKQKDLEKKQADVERRLDEELSDTFPASDAPSFTQPGAVRRPTSKSDNLD